MRYFREHFPVLRFDRGELNCGRFVVVASMNEQLCIEILSGASTSPLHIDEAAQFLLDELRSIPHTSVRRVEGGPADPGTKSIANNLPEIVVACSAAGALLPTIVATIRDWLLRQRPTTTIKVKDGDFELEWSGVTPPATLANDMARLLARRQG